MTKVELLKQKNNMKSLQELAEDLQKAIESDPMKMLEYKQELENNLKEQTEVEEGFAVKSNEATEKELTESNRQIYNDKANS